MRNTWHIFLSVFFTLRFAYEQSENPSEGLAQYLSEANPFIWADKGSADPAIWAEFEREYNSRFPDGEATDTESLSFVRDYLAEKGPYYIRIFPGGDEISFLELFDAETDLAEWTRMLDDLEQQEREMKN